MNLLKGYRLYSYRQGASIIGANLRVWSEKHGFFGWHEFVNTYIERDKKFLKLAVFGVQVAALLIDF